jgi:general secretion pathway protein I
MRSVNRRHLQSLSSRTGLTLYEVVLSLTLFLGAMLAISQIISTGSRAAVQSRLQTQAILRCESKLSEILAGVEPMESVSNTQFEEETAKWVWSLEIGPGPHEALLDLTVSVSHISQDGNPDSTYSLRRFVRDPQLFVDAAEAAAEAEAEAAAESDG